MRQDRVSIPSSSGQAFGQMTTCMWCEKPMSQSLLRQGKRSDTVADRPAPFVAGLNPFFVRASVRTQEGAESGSQSLVSIPSSSGRAFGLEVPVERIVEKRSQSLLRQGERSDHRPREARSPADVSIPSSSGRAFGPPWSIRVRGTA